MRAYEKDDAIIWQRRLQVIAGPSWDEAVDAQESPPNCSISSLRGKHCVYLFVITCLAFHIFARAYSSLNCGCVDVLKLASNGSAI